MSDATHGCGTVKTMSETTKIRPMLAEVADPATDYVQHGSWILEEKLDGVRLMLHVENGRAAAINRRGEQTELPASIAADLAVIAGGHFVFDGELIGKELWLFDLVVAGELITTATPFATRRKALETVFAAWAPVNIRLVASASTPEAKTELMARVVEAGGEGVMAKRINGLYQSGKRTDVVRKIKFWKTADVVVTEINRDGKTNAVVAVYDGDELVEIGSVSRHGRRKNGAKVGDVLEVKYLYCTDPDRPRLYQPAIMRVRHDKVATECSIDQLEYTTKIPQAA